MSRSKKDRVESYPGLANAIFQRDGLRCRYCGDTQGPFEIDHVYPVKKGGETSIDNLVMACKNCNRSKHGKVGVWPIPLDYQKPEKDVPWIAYVFLLLGAGVITGAIPMRPLPDVQNGMVFIGGLLLILSIVFISKWIVKR